MTILIVICTMLLVCIATLALLLVYDRRADRAEWQRLAAVQPADPAAYAIFGAELRAPCAGKVVAMEG